MFTGRPSRAVGTALTAVFSCSLFLGNKISALPWAKFRARLVSLILMISLLSATSPAAPAMIRVSLHEFGRDVRYAYLTSPTVAYLSEIDLTDNFIFAFFLG